MTKRTLLGGLAASCLLAATAGAQTVQITPSKDNTLYEPDTLGDRSNAVGPQMYSGRIGGIGGGNGLRRGVLSFDVAGSIPSGATITSATLTVLCSRVPVFDNGNPRTHELHRLTADWGEGTSDAGISGGQGAPPTAGDATWNDAFFPGTPWGTAGGDLSATVSSAVSVPITGTYVFPSSSQLVADVQDMLDNPGTNFGWALTGDEVVAGVARSFDTREAPSYPLYGGTAPVLEVQYTVPVASVPAMPRGVLAVLGVLLAGGATLILRRRG